MYDLKPLVKLILELRSTSPNLVDLDDLQVLIHQYDNLIDEEDVTGQCLLEELLSIYEAIERFGIQYDTVDQDTPTNF